MGDKWMTIGEEGKDERGNPLPSRRLQLRTKKDLTDESGLSVCLFGDTITGTDEHDGWIRVRLSRDEVKGFRNLPTYLVVIGNPRVGKSTLISGFLQDASIKFGQTF